MEHGGRSRLDLGCREPQDPDALFAEPRGPPVVMLLSVGMDRAIDLDRELCSGAVEIEDKWSDWVLTPKMQAGLITP
jgi:hypothetical protein